MRELLDKVRNPNHITNMQQDLDPDEEGGSSVLLLLDFVDRVHLAPTNVTYPCSTHRGRSSAHFVQTVGALQTTNAIRIEYGEY